MDIEPIKRKIKVRNYLVTTHATEQMNRRLIEPREAEEAILNGEIIEEYPDDKYGPTCLIYGKTSKERILHVQCSLPPMIWIITTYEPDPKEWIDGRLRRQRR